MTRDYNLSLLKPHFVRKFKLINPVCGWYICQSCWRVGLMPWMQMTTQWKPCAEHSANARKKIWREKKMREMECSSLWSSSLNIEQHYPAMFNLISSIVNLKLNSEYNMWNVRCEMFNVEYTRNVQPTPKQCSICNIQCTMLNILIVCHSMCNVVC